MTFEEARAAFPVLERYAYLNAGSVGPLSRATYEAMAAAERDELENGRAGWPYLERMLEARDRLRASLAALIGVESELVSLTSSTTEGCRIVLAGLELSPEDELVTTDAEHFGLTGALHTSGARVRVAKVRERPAAEALEAILAEVGPRTKLVGVSHVLWLNGHALPLPELKEALSVPLLVDGAQSVGAIPVDAAPFDFYTVSGQKWLCGPAPTGALYVREPDRLAVALPSYFSQAKYEPSGAFEPKQGALRFDPGWIPMSFLDGLQAAIDGMPEWRFERARELTDHCRSRLVEAGFDVVTEPGQGTLVSWRWEGDTLETAKRLGERGVIIRDLPGTGLLRASCGYWTSEEDIDRLLEGLRAVRRRILPAMSEYDAVAFDAFEEAGWGTKEAAGYDALAGRVTSRLADPLLDAVGAGPGNRVLDIATGPGYVAARAAERGADPVGLDLSETMLAFARSRSPNVEFVRGNATELPFPDGSFDAAIVAFLLLHVGRPEEVVAEAARVVAPGGRAAFSVWDDPSRGRWLGVVFDAFAAAGSQPPADVPPGPPIFRFSDESEFTRLLTGAGLVDVAVETVEFPLQLASGDELWTGLVDGTVRVRPMILEQSAEMQRAIRTHFDELLEDYRTEDGFDVPVSVKLASGRKS